MTTEFPQLDGILLDIEGTTSSIRFVYDVMFPFVRQNLAGFLADNWDASACQDCLPLLAADVGSDPASWLDSLSGTQDKQARVAEVVIEMMDNDVKATGLKQLQGLIWKSGFESGEMVAHVYEDVIPSIEHWKSLGIDIRIYSSGSIGAQKLFFGHTEGGNLLHHFTDHYDTTTGSKRETASYAAIAKAFARPAERILFVSDVVEELDAAKAAGFETALSLRPGNKPVTPEHGHPEISSFAQIGFCS